MIDVCFQIDSSPQPGSHRHWRSQVGLWLIPSLSALFSSLPSLRLPAAASFFAQAKTFSLQAHGTNPALPKEAGAE